MPKSDDKGEPVQTVRIGGREIEVPVIFILPEEVGEKEIERYEHPKVHIKKEEKASESKEEPLEELTDGKLEEIEKPAEEEEETEEEKNRMVGYPDRKMKKPKERLISNYYDFEKAYGKAQALKKLVEAQRKRDEEKKPEKTSGIMNYNYLFGEPEIEEKKEEKKSLGALGWAKLNRDGTKKKLRKRQPVLDDFPDDNGDKKDES